MNRLRALALFFALALSYGYFYQGGGWNQNSRLDLTRAMVERGTLRIDAYHGNTNDKARRNGSYYSDKAPGLSWAAAPWYAAVRLVLGGDDPGRLLTVGAWLATWGAVGLPTALAALVLGWMAGSLGATPGWQAALAAAYGLGTLAFPYATLLYGHQLAAALLLLGFAALFRARRGDRRWQAALLGCAGIALGLAVTVEYPALLVVAVLTVYAGAVIRPRRRLVWLIAGGAGPALLLMAYHALAFGGPLTLPYHFSTRPQRHAGLFMGLGLPRPEALWQLTLGSYRGLFFSAPWLLLGIPGAVALMRRRESRPEALTCVAAVALLLWMSVSLVDWEGGWTLGARYLIPALPFLALACAGVLGGPPLAPRWRRARRVAVPALMGLSVVMMLIGTSVKPEVPMEIRHPWGSDLVPGFMAGDLARNETGFDDFMPSGRRRAWNLGQRLGLPGLASLLPLMAVWAVAGIVVFRRGRVSAAGSG